MLLIGFLPGRSLYLCRKLTGLGVLVVWLAARSGQVGTPLRCLSWLLSYHLLSAMLKPELEDILTVSVLLHAVVSSLMPDFLYRLVLFI